MSGYTKGPWLDPALEKMARAAIAKAEGPQSYPEIGEGGES